MAINCLSSSISCSRGRRVSSCSVSLIIESKIDSRNDFSSPILSFLSADLSRNRLAKISGEAFVNLSNLTHLDVSYNKLSALELDYMRHLPRLQSLSVSGNIHMNLLDTGVVFENLTLLSSLSMADITNMPAGIFIPLSNLETLNISGTHLGNETNQMLEPLKKLKVRNQPHPFKVCSFFLRTM